MMPTEDKVLAWITATAADLPADLRENVDRMQVCVTSPGSLADEGKPYFTLRGYPNKGTSFECVFAPTLVEVIEKMRAHIVPREKRVGDLRQRAAALLLEAEGLERTK